MLLQRMVNGIGEHGHHAQQHVEQELVPEQQTAKDHSTLGCPAVALGHRLETAVVNLCCSISFFKIFYQMLLYLLQT